MRIPLLLGCVGVVAVVIAAQSDSAADSLLTRHTQVLQAAASFKAQFTIQALPGGPASYKLEFSKPSKFLLDGPDQTIVADGATVWTLNKTKNSYTELPQTDADMKAFLKKDAVVAWGAFFAKQPFKDFTDVKVGGKHTMAGNNVTEVTLTLPGMPERTGTLYIDQALGIARGFTIHTGPDKDTLILAKVLQLSKDPAQDADFQFAIPTGAKKVDPNAKSAGTTWDAVSGIFNSNCVGCHNSGRPRSGLDLSTYAGAIAGGRGGKDVVPGDPDNSPIMAYLKASGKPQMPPNGPLSDDDIAKIQSWIKDGANEK